MSLNPQTGPLNQVFWLMFDAIQCLALQNMKFGQWCFNKGNKSDDTYAGILFLLIAVKNSRERESERETTLKTTQRRICLILFLRRKGCGSFMSTITCVSVRGQNSDTSKRQRVLKVPKEKLLIIQNSVFQNNILREDPTGGSFEGHSIPGFNEHRRQHTRSRTWPWTEEFTLTFTQPGKYHTEHLEENFWRNFCYYYSICYHYHPHRFYYYDRQLQPSRLLGDRSDAWWRRSKEGGVADVCWKFP